MCSNSQHDAYMTMKNNDDIKELTEDQNKIKNENEDYFHILKDSLQKMDKYNSCSCCLQ